MVTRRQAYMPHARHWVAKLTQAALPNSLRWKPGCLEALALQPLALQLTGPAHSFRGFAGAALRRLLVMPPKLHFAENPLPLHLLLERLERLVDIVVTHENLHLAANSFAAAHSGIECANSPTPANSGSGFGAITWPLRLTSLFYGDRTTENAWPS